MIVIGFEGAPAPRAPINWGAAALRGDDGAIYNSATGMGRLRTPEEEARLHICWLPRPYDHPDVTTTDGGAVVLRITRTAYNSLDLSHVLALGGLASIDVVGERRQAHFLICPTSEIFAAFQSAVAESVICRAMNGQMLDVPRRRLLTLATTITAHNGRLNAVQAWYGREGRGWDREMNRQMGRARSSQPGEHNRFDEQWALLSR